MMQARPSERVVPSSNTETAAAAFNDLKSELAPLTAEMHGEMFNIWSTGVIYQLANLPVDLRIETWIYNSYSGFRDTQVRSVAVDVDNCLQGLSDKVRKNTPEKFLKRAMPWSTPTCAALAR